MMVLCTSHERAEPILEIPVCLKGLIRSSVTWFRFLCQMLQMFLAIYAWIWTIYGLKVHGLKKSFSIIFQSSTGIHFKMQKYDVLGIPHKSFSPNWVWLSMSQPPQSPLVFPVIKMLVIIIEVFLPSKQRSVHLECCCTICLMSAACVCQMVYHGLPYCNAQTTCTPIQLKASIKWK